MRKKIFIILLSIFSVSLVNAQEDDEYFNKDYKFPLQINENGKCYVSGSYDFSNAKLDNDDIFTNLFIWVSQNIGQSKIIKKDPSNKILSCRFYIDGISTGVNGKNNRYYISTAFRVADKHLFIKQEDITVLPAISMNKKETGIEKYAALKKPSDKNLIEDFNGTNNESIKDIAEFIENNVLEVKVTHWDNILSKRIVEGMTMTETELALGKPQAVVEGTKETQWIYGLSLIVYFDNNKYKDPKTGKMITNDKRVSRILR